MNLLHFARDNRTPFWQPVAYTGIVTAMTYGAAVAYEAMFCPAHACYPNHEFARMVAFGVGGASMLLLGVMAVGFNVTYTGTPATIEQTVASSEALEPESDAVSQFFNFRTVMTSPTTGEFVHATQAQLQHVANLVKRGEYSLKHDLIVKSGLFSRAQWKAFQDEMVSHRWASRELDGQVILNASGRHGVAIAARGGLERSPRPTTR